MSNKATYAEIIEALSLETGFSKQKSEAFAKALINTVKRELQETGKASITNFGSFMVKEVAERQGLNPQTGEPITIPAHKRVSFTPYKALRERVNAPYAHLETELIEEEEDKIPPIIKSEAEERPEEEPETRPEPESSLEEEEVEKEPETERETGFGIESEEIEPDPESETEFEYEPEPEEEPAFEPEPESEPEPQMATEKLTRRTFQRERNKGKSTGLILMVVLALVVVAFASIWFLMDTDEEDMAADQAAIEAPQTPEASSQMEQESTSATATTDTETAETAEEESGQQTDEASGLETTSQAAAEFSSTDEIYRVQQDEWYWVISRKIYGKAHFWPLIYQQNFTINDHPDSLEKNVRLEIPAMEGSAENPTSGDYGKLAAASKMVSEAYQKFGNRAKAEEYAEFARRWELRSRR